MITRSLGFGVITTYRIPGYIYIYMSIVDTTKVTNLIATIEYYNC